MSALTPSRSAWVCTTTAWSPASANKTMKKNAATIVLMAFTYNIGVGMSAGLVLYPLMKVAAGRWREVHPALLPLSAISLLFFVFYPYH